MINVNDIRKFKEDEINKKIDAFDQPNLNREQKRLIILDQMNTSKTYTEEISFPNNLFVLFDVKKVRDLREKRIEEKMKNITDDKIPEKQKRLLVLDEMNTSISGSDKEEEEEETKINLDKNEEIKNQTNEISMSTTNESLSTMHSTGISEFSIEKKNYWIQYELYDAKAPTNLKGLILHTLDEEKGKEKYCYLYNNKLTTFYYIQNVKFGKDYSINENLEIDSNYNSSLGLFFCGKKIELENEETKKCCPNEMICKDCMEKNKKRYNLQSQYLININGRAAKKYKGTFHCYGHFMEGNQIENCLKKFSCEACKLLDKYEKYYFPS